MFKQIKGRKRHLVVDTLGLLLAVVVHSAGLQDSHGAKLVLAKLKGCFPRLRLIWADGAYGMYDNMLMKWLAVFAGWVLEIVKRPAEAKGFALLPRRWVVERSFAWAARFRRLARDYERLPETVAGLHFLAFAILMLKRLVDVLAQSS